MHTVWGNGESGQEEYKLAQIRNNLIRITSIHYLHDGTEFMNKTCFNERRCMGTSSVPPSASVLHNQHQFGSPSPASTTPHTTPILHQSDAAVRCL